MIILVTMMVWINGWIITQLCKGMVETLQIDGDRVQLTKKAFS